MTGTRILAAKWSRLQLISKSVVSFGSKSGLGRESDTEGLSSTRRRELGLACERQQRRARAVPGLHRAHSAD